MFIHDYGSWSLAQGIPASPATPFLAVPGWYHNPQLAI
jgi:hypothetical protein